ncbi:MAG: restriction endonuclease subunit S [Carboxylicivirga sp.]|jgi:type I restriction enzyme S subunit|nr:restriction endonuclease subunit S [Carboxylicivirga sp.]
MSKDKNIPQVRFNGFNEAWKVDFLGNLACFAKGQGYSKNELSDIGHPIVLYGRLYTKYQTVISAVDTFVKKLTYKVYSEGNEVLVPASGETPEDIAVASALTVPNVLLGGDLNIIRPKNQIDSIFLALTISNGNVQKDLSKRAQGKSVVHLRNDDLKSAVIKYSELLEQQKIGSYFNQLDQLITQKQKKHQKLQQLKKAMLHKMFPQNGATKPEIRFKGFEGEWEENELNDLCSVITKQTGFDYSATIKPSLLKNCSSNSYSFLQNKDFEGSNINLNTDFYIPKDVAESFPNILIDRPSILISISGKIGNVGLYQLDSKAFIGGAVGIAKLVNKNNGLIILYNLLSNNGKEYFQALTKASSHLNITVEDIRRMKIQVPISNKEKIKIGNYFKKLDHLISLQQKEITKLKNIKKALLEKMFV